MELLQVWWGSSVVWLQLWIEQREESSSARQDIWEHLVEEGGDEHDAEQVGVSLRVPGIVLGGWGGRGWELLVDVCGWLF